MKNSPFVQVPFDHVALPGGSQVTTVRYYHGSPCVSSDLTKLPTGQSVTVPLATLVKLLDLPNESVYNVGMLLMKTTPKNMKKVMEEMRTKRNEEIRALYKSYKENPLTGWTIEKIATEYGITKQRVWQIVEEGK
jgi:hypothetical protein